MANRYWVNINAGADGNWDNTSTTCWSATDGGPTGASAPTASDNVFFTALSGTAKCVISVGDCLNIDTTGYQGTFGWASTGSLLRIYGNTTFTKSITGTNNSGGVRFLALSSNLTINAGTSFATSPVQIGSGSAGTLRCDLTSNFSAATITVLANASFYTQGFTVTTTGAITTSSILAAFNPGSSIINCGGIATFANNTFVSGANSTINCNGTFAANTNTYGTVVITPTTSTANLTGGGTFTNLTFNYSNNICPVTTISGTHTVTGTFTVVGSDVYPKIQNGEISAANVNLSKVLFSNFTGSGAATWSGTNIGRFSSPNSGNFVYTTGGTNVCTGSGTKSWYDASLWSLGRPPLPQDDAVIRTTTSSSLTFNVLINTFPPYIKSFRLETTSTGGIDFTNATDINIVDGGLYFDVGTKIPQTGSIFPSFNFVSQSTGNYNITRLSSDVTIQTLSFNDTSTYNITSNMLLNGTLSHSTGVVNFANGITFEMFILSSTGNGVRSLVFGSGVNIICGRSWTINGNNLTLTNLENTPLTFSETTSSTCTFAGGGKTYGEVLFTGSSGIVNISGANTFAKLSVVKNGANTVNFPGNTTTTIGEWNISGKSGSLVTLYVTGGSAQGIASLVKTGAGIVSANYLSIQNVQVSPTTNTWYAGGNSVNVANTTGWIFTPAPGTSIANSLFFGSFF